MFFIDDREKFCGDGNMIGSKILLPSIFILFNKRVRLKILVD